VTKKDKPVLRTPIPGAVPILAIAPGTLVSSSTSNQMPAQPPPRNTPVPAARTTPVPGAVPAARNTPGTLPLPPPVATPPVATPVAAAVPDEAPTTVGDVTERVRLPRRPSSSTTHVRVEGRRRSTLPWIGGLVVIAGGIAAAIAFNGGSTSMPATAPALETPPPAVETPPPEVETPPPEVEAPSTAPVQAHEEPPVPVEATDPPAAVDTPPPAAPVEAHDEPAEAEAPPPVKVEAPPAKVAPPTKRVIRRPVIRKKPVTQKPEPKETKAWNADSPFMPVRTDKH
jgi:hypothetical protein